MSRKITKNYLNRIYHYVILDRFYRPVPKHENILPSIANVTPNIYFIILNVSTV